METLIAFVHVDKKQTINVKIQSKYTKYKNMGKYPKESKTIANYHKLPQCSLCYPACMVLLESLGQAVLCLTS
jgi:hypothetical protein